MHIHERNRQRGYTLAEVLVAVAVFAIVILAALTLYDRSNRVFREGVESSNLQQNTRVAFNKLVSDLRMAGFDFDRDGIPTGAVAGGTNQYQQPDEQFEYIGPAAVTIRGNFDFERESAPCSATVTDNCDNGREKSYESTYFPVVTTGNDEIVTYALVPDSQTTIPACDPMTNCVEFYADTHVPRRSYPDTGGLDETLVQIPGVDLCMNGCNNPPYTLYRFTLARDQSNFTNGQHVTRTPLAGNIRSMRFTYFQDTGGLQVLRDVNDTGNLSSGATIRGLGQFRVNSATPIPQRLVRGKVNSLRIELIGMNERADRDYRAPGETIAAVQNFRQYRLETLVAPRNIQKRGIREQSVFPPGPPTDVTLCTGPCGGIYVSWKAPAETANRGAPDQYQILVDDASALGWSCSVPIFSGTSAHVFRTSCGWLEPNKTYKVAVVAINDFGSATSAPTHPTATPLNNTQAEAPELLSVSDDQNGQITLTWRRPKDNAAGGVTCGPPDINPAEILGYLVERTTDPSDPASWAQVGSGSVTMSSPHEIVTWADTSVINCTVYHYRVKLVERCAINAAFNAGGNIALGSSAFSTEMQGEAVSTAAPKGVDDLQVDQTMHNPTGTTADAHMSWPRVAADENGEAINVETYAVYRRPLGATTWSNRFPVTVDPSSETVTFQNLLVPVMVPDPITGVPTPQQYQYSVTAVQCGNESAEFTPYRLWPCTFPTGVIGAPPLSAVGSFDGDGSAANPWRIVDNGGFAQVNLNVLNGALIQQIDALIYREDGSLKEKIGPIGGPVANGPLTLSWAIEEGDTEGIVVTIVDATGCTMVASGWVSDEAQNCCLLPASFDGTVVEFTAGGTTVDFILRNVCGEQLNIGTVGRVIITWLQPSGPVRLDSVTYIPPSGTTTSNSGLNAQGGTVTVTPPTATAPVPAGSTNYRIRVTFNRVLSANPISAFAVEYRRPSDLATQAACPIVP
jgi:prepilin-type N-terminal cleavage/methylation domain-containing protein